MERLSNVLNLLFTAVPVLVLFFSWFLLSHNRRGKLEELKTIGEVVSGFEVPEDTDPLADLKWETFTTSLARYSRLSSKVRISVLLLLEEILIVGIAANALSGGIPYTFGCLLEDGTHIFGRDAFDYCPAKIPYYVDSFTIELIAVLVLFTLRLWAQIDEIVNQFLVDEYSRLQFGLRVLASKTRAESSSAFQGPLKPVDPLIWKWIDSFYFPLVALAPNGDGRASTRSTVALLCRALAVIAAFLTESIWASRQQWQEAYGLSTALVVGVSLAVFCGYFLMGFFFEVLSFVSARQAMDDSIREFFGRVASSSAYVYGGTIDAKQFRTSRVRPRRILSLFKTGRAEG